MNRDRNLVLLISSIFKNSGSDNDFNITVPTAIFRQAPLRVRLIDFSIPQKIAPNTFNDGVFSSTQLDGGGAEVDVQELPLSIDINILRPEDFSELIELIVGNCGSTYTAPRPSITWNAGARTFTIGLAGGNGVGGSRFKFSNSRSIAPLWGFTRTDLDFSAAGTETYTSEYPIRWEFPERQFVNVNGGGGDPDVNGADGIVVAGGGITVTDNSSTIVVAPPSDGADYVIKSITSGVYETFADLRTEINTVINDADVQAVTGETGITMNGDGSISWTSGVGNIYLDNRCCGGIHQNFRIDEYIFQNMDSRAVSIADGNTGNNSFWGIDASDADFTDNFPIFIQPGRNQFAFRSTASESGYPGTVAGYGPVGVRVERGVYMSYIELANAIERELNLARITTAFSADPAFKCVFSEPNSQFTISASSTFSIRGFVVDSGDFTRTIDGLGSIIGFPLDASLDITTATGTQVRKPNTALFTQYVIITSEALAPGVDVGAKVITGQSTVDNNILFVINTDNERQIEIENNNPIDLRHTQFYKTIQERSSTTTSLDFQLTTPSTLPLEALPWSMRLEFDFDD